MDKDEAKNAALAAISARGGTCNDNALRSDHLPHDAATGVRRDHDIGRDTELLSGKFLQASKEYIG